MKIINGLMNTITYIGTLCFIMSVMVLGALGVEMVNEILPTYFLTMKDPKFIEYVLWGGYVFIVFLSQQVGYKLWKNHLKLS